MPQRVLCDNCGEVLYQGVDIKSPEEIYQIHNGRCPKCGRKLSLMPQRVRVLPAREALRGGENFDK
ncbi:MAG: hypothetical protein QW782_09810 [Candidatus Bathyarchaeia archaeon]